MLKYLVILLVIVSPAAAGIITEELGVFGGTGNAPGMFKGPSGIDFSEDGRLFIADRRNHRGCRRHLEPAEAKSGTDGQTETGK